MPGCFWVCTGVRRCAAGVCGCVHRSERVCLGVHGCVHGCVRVYGGVPGYTWVRNLKFLPQQVDETSIVKKSMSNPLVIVLGT